jgi:hypothetical protein
MKGTLDIGDARPGMGRAPSVAAPEAAAEEVPWRSPGGEADDKDEVETVSVAGSAPGALDAGDMDARMVDMLDVLGTFCLEFCDETLTRDRPRDINSDDADQRAKFTLRAGPGPVPQSAANLHSDARADAGAAAGAGADEAGGAGRG